MEVSSIKWVAFTIPLWFWWLVVAEPVSSLAVVDQHSDPLFNNMLEIRFTTNGATAESYFEFISLLRDTLASGEFSNEIPVTREPSNVPDSQRYFLVRLTNYAGDSIALGIDITNSYVVGYRTGGLSFFVDDTPENSGNYLFTGTNQNFLGFSSTYASLQRAAVQTRREIPLGIEELDSAISNLYHYRGEGNNRLVARALIICIQMISEAARFRQIENRVRQSISESQDFLPDRSIIRLENNWGALSEAVQTAIGGVFARAIQLLSPTTFETEYVDNVNHISVIRNLAFMLFACRSASNAGALQFLNNNMLIQPVTVSADDVCVIEEPTVRIRGRDGLCVDVHGGFYNDGNPIVLWPCKSNNDANQLWTLKRDGTIRSNGKCLTTFGYSPEVYVMIYDCSTAARDATIWQVWVNGSIINPRARLALTASSGDSGTTLTVDTHIYASRQGWLATNNTRDLVTSIVGFRDLCLQGNYSNRDVWVAACQRNNLQQQWVSYPDSSIRPSERQDHCLTSNNHDQGRNIIITSCSPGWASQRWMFTEDGYILNLFNGMVMAVPNSDPSRRQIVIWPPTGNPDQKWLRIRN
ncbi:abrin-a-like [Diospyros lotus]|uniref:abrin-a-like n=1 Tax=Diospyros lotus TaxID=55363 RepID=UPI00224D3607|nr:abrin-a-like [Diospyros lotus]